MAQIIVRNSDGSVVERLKNRTRINGRSLDAEVRLILEQSAKVDMATAHSMAMEMRRKLKGRKFPDDVELI